MQIVLFKELAPLARWAADWDRLARGVPFRGWPWLAGWWEAYGAGGRGRTLSVLGVFDGERAMGFAPWYMERAATKGHVLKFLGLEGVCSDYLSLLCRREDEAVVAEAIAGWLRDHADAWDLVELAGVDAADTAVGRLAAELEIAGAAVHRRAGPNCWRLELPASWEAHLAGLSKDHRKQLRRIERELVATGRAVLHVARTPNELAQAQEILVDLHQRRRESLGQPGCFAAAPFMAFHATVMPELLRREQLELAWLELDGRPAAAEYQMAGGGVVYAYQSGVAPEALAHSPGRIAGMLALRRAIETGCRAYDFLRGDEPYKAHWGARPRPSIELRAAPARAAAQLRHNLWCAGAQVKGWLKTSLGMVEA